ncbi:tRNA modification GTPase GTPBP3, mitochondrial isoform X2 [Procambarus clarkii]|nr:tRNA modification GTPase GTPBP3, mitochondrial-like isoform X2 [Procambarus clarkii]
MTEPATLPSPRVATLRKIIHPLTGEGLDQGLVLWFPGPHSFTGEDCCELHVHGGLAVIAALLAALSTLPGYQPAQPGDFTKRAFYHGKLDLTSVEGLGDLIHAETEAQRRQALQQMSGSLAHLYNGWRRTLLQCRAGLEAYIDFSEDENIEEGVVADIEAKILKLIEDLECHLLDERRGERLRSGVHLAILGRPNVGKSSFLNTLTRQPTAIVSPIPGTTRDVVETSLDLGGYPVVVSDTAGLRETKDSVEAEGVRRALARAHCADIAVIILDALEILSQVKKVDFDWNKFLINYFKEIGIYDCESDNLPDGALLQWMQKKNYVTLINKIDLIECEQDRHMLVRVLKDSCLLLSLKTQEGFGSALQKLTDLCACMCEVGTAENPTLTTARHRTHISACLKALKYVICPQSESARTEDVTGSVRISNIFELQTETLHHQSPFSGKGMKVLEDSSRDISNNVSSVEIIDGESLSLLHSEETMVVAAHYLHRAATSLGHITGHITTEDVLDHIFSSFCIGK